MVHIIRSVWAAYSGATCGFCRHLMSNLMLCIIYLLEVLTVV